MTLAPLIEELREALMGGSKPKHMSGAGAKAKSSQGARKFRSKVKAKKQKKTPRKPNSPKPPKGASKATHRKFSVP
jgi:hypothetical protein